MLLSLSRPQPLYSKHGVLGTDAEVHLIALLLLAPESRGDSDARASVTRWLETVRSASVGYVDAAAWFFPTTVDGLLVEVKGVLHDALAPTGFETMHAVSPALYEVCPSVGLLTRAKLCNYTGKLKRGGLRGPGEYRTL